MSEEKKNEKNTERSERGKEYVLNNNNNNSVLTLSSEIWHNFSTTIMVIYFKVLLFHSALQQHTRSTIQFIHSFIHRCECSTGSRWFLVCVCVFASLRMSAACTFHFHHTDKFQNHHMKRRMEAKQSARGNEKSNKKGKKRKRKKKWPRIER